MVIEEVMIDRIVRTKTKILLVTSIPESAAGLTTIFKKSIDGNESLIFWTVSDSIIQPKNEANKL